MDYDELDLSANQKVILKKFRSSLQDILTPEYTDAKILKWLRASNFDLKKAEQIFREVNSCRKIFGTNTITDTYIVPEVLQKYVRTGFLGFAKDGSAIRYYGLHVDVLGLAYSISLYDTFSFFSYVVESDLKKLKEQNEKTGQNHSKITFILDFDEFSYKDIFHKFVIDAGLDMFSNFQGHYPESWSVFLMINAPYIVDKILMLFKPAFKSRFLDSFQVATRSSTSTLLKNYIDEDLLPVFLGGSRVDSTGDPLCRELINGYHKVPEKFYLKNIMHFIDETDPDVKVVILRPWSVYNFPVTVKEAGTKIRVEIRTENGSLHFTILHRNFSSNSDFEFTESKEKLNFDDESLNLRVVGPRVKGHTQISPYDFMLHAHWSGFYIFYFENTSSWFTSQKLYYRITIFPPDL